MKSRGFTLIELVMVIVILGALAAVALPKFVDLKSDAEKAVIESSVGSIATARVLWVAKAAACGSPYASVPFGVFTFLHFDTNVSRPPTCDDFNTGFGSVTPGPVGVMDLTGMKQGVQGNPDDNLNINNNGVSDTLSFTSKSGRTVSIVVNMSTGAVKLVGGTVVLTGAFDPRGSRQFARSVLPLLAIAAVAMLVRSDTAPGMTAKFLLSKVVYSTSDGAVLFLLGFSAVALLVGRLSFSARANSAGTVLLISGLLLGYGMHLGATVSYHLANDIGFAAHVYHWSAGANSYTALLHSHLGKAVMAPLSSFLADRSRYDAGGALAGALPGWQVAGIGLGFLAAAAGALLRMPGLLRGYGHRPALLVLYMVSAATAIKCIFDGGLLAYAVPPSLLLLGSFVFCTEDKAWSAYWLRRGWVHAFIVLGAYASLWIGLANDELPLIGAWMFLGVILLGLMTSAWRGSIAWAVRLLMVAYLVLNAWLDFNDNVLPLLSEVGARHRAAVFNPAGKSEVLAMDAWRGMPVFRLYRALGDDPWKPRKALVWQEPSTGARRLQASVRVIDMDQQRGQLRPTPSLRVSRVVLLRKDWIDLEFQGTSEELPPVLLYGAASALSRNNYYVWLYQIDLLLRSAGWTTYVLMPHTQGNAHAD